MKAKDINFEEYVIELKTKINNKTTVKIGNKTLDLSCVRNIHISDDNDLIIDGDIVKLPSKQVIIIINGNCENVTGENVYVSGDVKYAKIGNLKADDIEGNVVADSVFCKTISGNVKATNVDVKGDVESYIQAETVSVRGFVNNRIEGKDINIGGDVMGNVVGTNITINGDKY